MVIMDNLSKDYEMSFAKPVSRSTKNSTAQKLVAFHKASLCYFPVHCYSTRRHCCPSWVVCFCFAFIFVFGTTSPLLFRVTVPPTVCTPGAHDWRDTPWESNKTDETWTTWTDSKPRVNNLPTRVPLISLISQALNPSHSTSPSDSEKAVSGRFPICSKLFARRYNASTHLESHSLTVH